MELTYPIRLWSCESQSNLTLWEYFLQFFRHPKFGSLSRMTRNYPLHRLKNGMMGRGSSAAAVTEKNTYISDFENYGHYAKTVSQKCC